MYTYAGQLGQILFVCFLRDLYVGSRSAYIILIEIDIKLKPVYITRYFLCLLKVTFCVWVRNIEGFVMKEKVLSTKHQRNTLP